MVRLPIRVLNRPVLRQDQYFSVLSKTFASARVSNSNQGRGGSRDYIHDSNGLGKRKWGLSREDLSSLDITIEDIS